MDKVLNLFAVGFSFEENKLVVNSDCNLSNEVRDAILTSDIPQQILQNAWQNLKPISTTIERPEPKKWDDQLVHIKCKKELKLNA